MKKIASSEIGFYGKPIDQLTREELEQALIELASAIKECLPDYNKFAKTIFIKENNETDE